MGDIPLENYSESVSVESTCDIPTFSIVNTPLDQLNELETQFRYIYIDEVLNNALFL